MTIELELWPGTPHSYPQDREIKAFFSEMSEPEGIFLLNCWSIPNKFVD